MNKNNHIGLALEELYRVFDLLNIQYFNSMPQPMLTIQYAARENTLGWFTLDEVWEHEEVDKKYEINICANYLNRDIHDIVGTLQHEMVHYANKLAETTDCNGKIHNKKFKRLAESVDLFVGERSQKYGWGETHCNETLIKFIDEVIKPDETLFKYFRNGVKKPKVQVEKLCTYTCTECGEKIKAKEDADVLCGICNKKFERKTKGE